MTAAEVRQVRAYIGVTQAQLAARVGVYRQTVTRWEATAPGADASGRKQYRAITKQLAYAILNAALVMAAEKGLSQAPIKRLFTVVDSRMKSRN